VALSSGASCRRQARSLRVGEGGAMGAMLAAYTHKARFAAFEGATQFGGVTQFEGASQFEGATQFEGAAQRVVLWAGLGVA